MNHEEAVKLCESVGLRVRVKNDPILSTIDIPCGPITTHPMAAALIVQHMQERTCDWMLADPDDDMWMGDCGIAFGFVDGGPEDNDMEFCPRCGGRLQVKEGEDD